MALSPIPGPAFRSRTFSNVQPFTYEDGLTVAEVLSRLIAWFREEVVPAFGDVTEYVDQQISEMITYVDQSIVSLEGRVDDSIDANQTWVTEEIDSLTTYVDNAVQQIINNSIELQDPVVAGMVNDETSQTYPAVLNATHPKTLLVPDSTDATFAWQSAVDDAISLRANGEVADDETITIKGLTTDYAFAGTVYLRGLRNAVLQGSESGNATIRPAAGAGSLIAFRVNAGPFNGSTENITIRGFTFEGGLTSSPAPGVHDRRQDNVWADDRMNAALYMNGNLVPSESAAGTVDGVTVEGCRFIGLYSLPVHLRGVSNVVMRGNYLWRSLDTGFVHCKSVQFTGNRVEWSADNGVSVSRGCTQVVIADNTIEGSYYAGIHVGGFSGEAGASHVTISGNTVLNSRQYGISAISGTRNATITGNVVDGVMRGAPSNDNRDAMGDRAPISYGTGILFGGLMTGETTANAAVVEWSTDVLITGNLVKNADRCGIMSKGGVKRINITGNTVTNVGSKFSTGGGTEIPATHLYYNIGIGIYGLSRDFIEELVVVGNMVEDTRSTPIIGRSFSCGDRATMAGNRDKNVRTPNHRGLVLAGSGAASMEIEFVIGSETPDFRISRLTDRTLRFYANNSGTNVNVMEMHRDGKVLMPNLRTISGVTSNLYLAQNGELRIIE